MYLMLCHVSHANLTSGFLELAVVLRDGEAISSSMWSSNFAWRWFGVDGVVGTPSIVASSLPDSICCHMYSQSVATIQQNVRLPTVAAAVKSTDIPDTISHRAFSVAARWHGTHYRISSRIQRSAQTVLGVYLKRTCSRVTSASSD